MADPVFTPARVAAQPERHAAGIWTETTFAHLGEVQATLRPLVRQEAQDAGLALAGATLTVWSMVTPERLRLAPAVLVEAAFSDFGSLAHILLPAGSAAHLRLEGPFEHLGEAWERLFTTCHAQGWRPAGLNWEVYENDDADGAPAVDLYAQLG